MVEIEDFTLDPIPAPAEPLEYGGLSRVNEFVVGIADNDPFGLFVAPGFGQV
jgi:hypothetical protein